jgi:Fe2+ or Zn2+ uptake regulation protein
MKKHSSNLEFGNHHSICFKTHKNQKIPISRCRHSSVCTARAGRPGFEFRQCKVILHGVQTNTGAHSPSHLMDSGGSFPGIKAAGA